MARRNLYTGKLTDFIGWGADAWNSRRYNEFRKSTVDLQGADLRYANLENFDLSGTNLGGANLRGARMSGAILNRADLRHANLRGADLSRAVMVGTAVAHANLTGCRVYGCATWDVDTKNCTHSDLIISRTGDSAIRVDTLEMAQFLYLLLKSQNIREVVDSITAKAVLILGRFAPYRRSTLESLKSEFRTRGYCPVLFDLAKPRSSDYVRQISTLANISRFVVADLTDAGEAWNDLPQIVDGLAVPIAPIMRDDGWSEPASLFDLRSKHRSILDTHRYADPDELVENIDQSIVTPAERRADELNL